MRKKNYKGRCEKRSLAKCRGICKSYDTIQSRYADMLQSKDTEENKTRLENIKELKSSINAYVQNAEDVPTLAGFLEEIALITDVDNLDNEKDAVTLMTVHSAKGLEFDIASGETKTYSFKVTVSAAQQ